VKHEDKFAELVERYNRFIEPLENWVTEDIVALIEVLDCELQQRVPSQIGVGELTSAEIAEYNEWSRKYFPIEDEL
jgi:hypothetical protein